MTINDKVQINQLGNNWTAKAIPILSGMTGHITDYSPSNYQEHDRERPYLVTFDKRPESWHSNQSPSHSWWFSENEITKL